MLEGAPLRDSITGCERENMSSRLGRLVDPSSAVGSVLHAVLTYGILGSARWALEVGARSNLRAGSTLTSAALLLL